MAEEEANSSSVSTINNSSNSSSLGDAYNALEFWKEFDFDSRRVSLDSTCVEMRELKVISMNGRKKLNELTKVLRSKSKEEQSNMITDVLKAYQEEIDQLSRRSKYSEAAYFNLYKSLSSAPDPYVNINSLISMVTSGSSQTLEIEKLRLELEEYDIEFQQLKNQEITVRRLEEQLQEYNNTMEEKIQLELDDRVRAIEEDTLSKIDEFSNLQKASEKRLLAALEATRQAEMSAESAQSLLFEETSQSELRINSLLSDNSILREKIDNTLTLLYEKENEILSANVMKLQSPSSSSDSHSDPGIQHVDTNSRQVSDLQSVIDTMEKQLYKNENESSLKIELLEARVLDLTNALCKEKAALYELQSELDARPTRDDLVSAIRKLRVLQRIVYNSKETSDDDDDDDGAYSSIRLLDSINIDNIIFTRIKALENELSEARNSLRSTQLREQSSQEDLAVATNELHNAKGLISRLEADLSDLTAFRSSHSSINDSSSNNELAELLGVSSISYGNKNTVTADRRDSSSNVTSTDSISSNNVSNNNQIVSVIQAQRDRYKEKLSQSEFSKLSLQQKVESLLSDKRQLESDNLVLYSKIKYYNNYRSSGMDMTPIKLYAESGLSDSESIQMVENKYHSLYEAKMNPFAAFSESERQRKVKELNVTDRVILNTALRIISSHTGRNVLLLYITAMHLLVFIVLYHTSHHSYYGCDPSLDHTHN